MKRKSLLKLIILSIFANLMVVQSLMANTSDLTTDFKNYIASKGLNVINSPISDINNCALCHADFDSFSSPHEFAFDFSNAGKNEGAFTIIEDLDSDGDGTSNVDEILQGFFPGLSCADLVNGNPIRDWPADRNLADFVDPSKPGCVDPVADIDVQPTALNFTTATIGTSKPITTVISNLGTADLTVTDLIFDANTSNDFGFGSGIPALPVVIAPNGSVNVEVVYTPSDVGSDSGVLIVVSDSPNEIEFPVTLLGEGIAPPNDCDIVLVPDVHDFGIVTIGETASQTINLQNQGAITDCNVNSINIGPASSPDFSVNSVATPLTIGPGGTIQVDVTYTPGEAGDDVGTLNVASNSINSPASATFSGSGEGVQAPLEPNISVTPIKIDFSAVIIGNSVVDITTVSNDGNAPLTIDSVSLLNGSDFAFGANLPITLASGTSTDIQITFTPTSEGTITDTLSISSDDPDEPAVPVILTGVGQTPPALECNIEVSTISLEFGPVQVATTQSLDITVANTGTADCDVNAFLNASSSPDFAFAGSSTVLPRTLAEGELITVTVDYTPAEVGDDTGMVTILSNDPDTGAVMVSLTGSGYEPNGDANLEVRELEAFLELADNLQVSAIQRTGYAQINFNETGTEAEIELSIKRRDSKGRGSKGRGGKGRDSKGGNNVTVTGAAFYCGAPETGQELISVFDFRDDGGMSVGKKWSYKRYVTDGDIITTTDCGANLFDIALSTFSGNVNAVIYTDAGDFVGSFVPRALDDDGDDDDFDVDGDEDDE